MTPLHWLGLGCCLAMAGCGSTLHEAPPAVLPGLEGAVNAVDRVVLSFPGQTAITLQRDATAWHWVERDWPADAARIRPLLLSLAAARCDEPKTARPANYPRIGVEPVTAPGAQSVQVLLMAGERRFGVLLGRDHAQGGRYLRSTDATGSCLSRTRPLAGAAPSDWLDTSLVDRPASHWRAIELRDSAGSALSLKRNGDRFAVSGRMPGESSAPDALAAALSDLQMDDVRRSRPPQPVQRTLRYLSDDGAITISLWRDDGAVWFQLTGEGGEMAVIPAAASDRVFQLPPHRVEALLAPPAALLAP